MNKLLTKVARLALGLSLAAGVGVAIESNKAQRADAAVSWSNASFTPGTNSVDVTVSYDGGSYSGVRSGTSKATGTTTITIPANATKLSLYAVGWKDKSVTMSLSINSGTISPSTWALTANSVATGTINSGASLSISGSNLGQEFTLSSSASSRTVTLNSSTSEKRFIAWNAQTGIEQAATLSSIALSGTYPTSFLTNDAFSHSGMVVTATYSDASTKDVTSSATWSSPDMTTTGSKTITVTYIEGGVTKTQTYTISVQAPSKSLSSIAVTTPPTKTSYEVGETFDSTGMVVTATFSDASTENVTNSCSYSPSGALSISDDEIEVSYTYGGTTKTTSQAINVHNPSKVTFTAGTDLGTTTGNTTPDSVSKMGITMSGDDAAFATSEYRYYSGSSLTFSSSIGDMTKIEFTGDSSKTMANISISSGGGSVSTSGNDATWTGKTDEVVFSFSAQNRATKVVVTLASSDTLLSIAVSGSMTKVNYTQYEAWDASGLVVNAYYQSAPSTPVDVTQDAEWTFDPTTTASTSTTSVIATATYEGQTASSTAQAVTISAASFTNTTNLTPGDYNMSFVNNSTTYYFTGSVSGGEGLTDTSVANAGIMTFALVGNDTWDITDGSGNYLRITGTSSTNLALDSTHGQFTINWLDSADHSKGRILTSVEHNARSLGQYNNKIRTYANSNAIGIFLNTAKTVTGFSVYDVGANKNVLKGSTFNAAAAAAAGFEARLNYSDLSYDNVTNDATWSLDTSSSGTKTLTVSYLEYTPVEINDINVYVAVITSLTIDSSQAKTSYVEGEELSLTGLLITGHDSSSNDYVLEIEDCTFSPASGTVLSTSNTSVTVTYTNENLTTASQNYSITVAAFVGYSKVTSASDLAVGESYVLGVANNNHAGDLMGAAKDESATAFRNKVDASSAFNGSYTTVTQSGASTAGAVVVTLLSDGAGKFAFYSITDDKYLAGTASGGYFINKSSLEDAGDNAWWTIEFADGLMSVTLNDSTRVLGYNLGAPRFATYASYAANSTTVTSGTAHPVLFKMAGSAVKTSVTSFANTSLKMNDSAYEGDISTANCESNYSSMKTAYAALSDAEKNVFQYSSDYANARARLLKWAAANHETFTYGAETPFSSARNVSILNNVLGESKNTIAIIVIISMVSVTAIGGYFFIRRRKEN